MQSQIQDKEKQYLELYNEKISLEEKILRDAKDAKIVNSRAPANQHKGLVGPPTTFMNPVSDSADPDEQQEEEKAAAVQKIEDAEVNIPQEMYDTIKQKLIEREAEFKKFEEVLFERNQECEKLSE